jgi:hypothetical protein
MIIKSYIPYSDWLMLKRGKIDPQVGDKIITNSAAKNNEKLQHSVVNQVSLMTTPRYNSKYNYHIHYKTTHRIIELIWVEIEIESSDIKL